MKITELALKSFNIIFGELHEKRESRFAQTFLYPGFQFSFHGRSGLYLEDIISFGNRCEDFGVRLIGLETIFDSEYPLSIEAFEEYAENYNINWLEKAVSHLEEIGIEKHIVPYFHIEKKILDQYLIDE
jgi:hypothetical protein